MANKMLTFEVRSGGKIAIDLGRCVECETKACVEVCRVQGGPLVLDGAQGVPSLCWSLEEIRGGRLCRMPGLRIGLQIVWPPGCDDHFAPGEV